MKRAVIAAIVLSMVFALPAFAIESNEPPNVPSKGPPPSFEQRKAQLLKNLGERNTRLQQEKDCVEASKKDDDLKACREKYGPSYGPGGLGRMGRPGGPTSPGGQTPQ
jgi:hypothetical protein